MLHPTHTPADLTYLASYEGMGTASVACASGCACERATIAALRPVPRLSYFINFPLPVRGYNGWSLGGGSSGGMSAAASAARAHGGCRSIPRLPAPGGPPPSAHHACSTLIHTPPPR